MTTVAAQRSWESSLPIAIGLIVALFVGVPLVGLWTAMALGYSFEPEPGGAGLSPVGGVARAVAGVFPETDVDWTINSSRMTSSSSGSHLARGRAVVHSASADSEEGRIAAALAKRLTDGGVIPAVEVTTDDRPAKAGAPLPDLVIRVEPRPADPGRHEEFAWVVTASDRWDRSNHSYSGYLTPPVGQWVWRGEISAPSVKTSGRLTPNQREKLVKKLSEEVKKAMEIDLPVLPPRDQIPDLFPAYAAPPELAWLKSLNATSRMAGPHLMTPTLAYWEFTTDEPPAAWYPAVRDALRKEGSWRDIPDGPGESRVILSVRDDVRHLEIFKRTDGMGEAFPPLPGPRTYVVGYERTWGEAEVDAALKAALKDPQREASVHMLSRYWYRDKEAVRTWLADHPPRSADAWLIVGDWHQQDGRTDDARAAWLNAHTLDRLVGSNKLDSAIRERVKKAMQEPLPLFPDEAGFAALGVETLDAGTSGRTFDIDASRPVVFRLDVQTAEEGNWQFLSFAVAPLPDGQVSLRRMETDWRKGGHSSGVSTTTVRPSDRNWVSYGESDGKSYQFHLLGGDGPGRYRLRVDPTTPSR